MGSSGVQRPLKFIKYLQKYGWKPVVIAPEPGFYTHFDDSLEEELNRIEPSIEVHRVQANTPLHIKGSGGKALGNLPDWLMEPLRLISSAIYLPDNKKAWIKPALEAAAKIIETQKIDAVFSSAPPYSNHLIAAEIKRRYGIPVLLDFRDDWYASHLIKYPTKLHQRKMLRLEKECLKQADAIIAINKAMLDSLKKRNKRDDLLFEVISQGYDPEDLELPANPTNIKAESHKLQSGSKITILYNGIFYGENQPDVFLEAVHSLIVQHPEWSKKIKLRFQGGLPKESKVWAKKAGIDSLIEDAGYLTHKEACKGLALADILWFVVGHKKSSEQVTPGKIFEYIGMRKVILGLVPENGEASKLLEQLKAGFRSPADDAAAVSAQLLYIIENLSELKKKALSDTAYEKYNRRNIAFALADVLNKISRK